MTAYTICVFTENTIGILNKITTILTRRRINIDSLTVSETERKGISRFTIVIRYDDDRIDKLVKQIRKIIENPEIEKPMMYSRKGTIEVYVPPFRLSYAYLKDEGKIVFLDLYHKDEQ